MKKVKTRKGYIIATCKAGKFHIFTKDEWECGEGFRYPEWEDCMTVEEAIEWIG